jgi:ubiquitin carboxyl-terminal hydrolase L5
MPHPDSSNEASDHIFFAKQIINNACATQAILSILLNHSDIELGEDLANFKAFTTEFPPDVRKYAPVND